MTMLRELVAAASGSGAADQLSGSACARAKRNTLSTQCYSACDQQYPLCVNYAALPANAASREGDGDYYYQGCPTNMTTCHSSIGAAQCQLQCLQSKNTVNTEWILDVAPPQTDRLETSLFVQVEKLSLPKTLLHMKLVGTTEHTRKVPITFEKDTFQSGTGLQKITLMDLGIGNISMNIFPGNLSTLIMQRTLLTQFDPVGGEPLTNLRVLDLSENYLTEIPKAVFTFQNLKELRLEGNNMTNVELTSAQLAFLRNLTTVGLTIEPPKSCAAGFTLYTWDSNTICYKDVGATDGSMNDNVPQSDSGPTASTTTKSGKMGIIIASLVAAVVLAILVGIFFLKRAKKRKNEARKSLMAEEKPKSKITASMRAMMSSKPNELSDPLRDMSSGELTPTRKATFREIPASEVRVIEVVAETSIVTVSLGEYNKKKVLVNRLRVSDDPAENCETALSVTPVVAQLRHPQLLSVFGFMWEDVHTMSAICEHMNRGTLEDYLLASSTSLTWRNFKLKAAMDIAGCLMYLHGQTHKLTYDALSGRTVFVDSEKGCKLSTMIACLPNGLVKSHLAKSTRGFCAPEIMAGDPSSPSSDMYAFGVLLAQLDTCETADEMIRSSLRQRSARDMTSFTDSNGLSSLPEDFTASSGSRGSRALSGSSGSSSSLLSMFSFTNDCPDVVKELAFSCLQIDPSSRPSAQYVTAMLQHSM